MMHKQKEIKLTFTEAEHLLHLIEVNEHEGWYYGWDKQYWSRSNKIKNKLITLIKELDKHKEKREDNSNNL